MRLRAVTAGLLLTAVSILGGGSIALAQEEGAEPELSHETEECLHILEEGGEPSDCQESPSPILPATNEIIWGGISFVVLLALMWKFAYPGVKRGMQARTERIRDNLDEAERTKADAARILEDYQRQLADARAESARIIDEARQTAEQMRRDLMDRAEAEVAELRQRSTADIEAARDRALADLRGQVAELAIGAAEVVVRKNLDPDTNRALVESYISQVAGSSR